MRQIAYNIHKKASRLIVALGNRSKRSIFTSFDQGYQEILHRKYHLVRQDVGLGRTRNDVSHIAIVLLKALYQLHSGRSTVQTDVNGLVVYNRLMNRYRSYETSQNGYVEMRSIFLYI